MSNVDYAKALLRYGFVFVFLWFGINQLTDTARWVGLIPEWITSVFGISAQVFVMINGAVEIILAAALLFNIYTPIVSILLGLHLVSIAIDVKFNAIGIRDLGLAIGMFALALLTWKEQN